jgi:hypothetical protein
MPRNWLPVYVQNDLNLVIAHAVRDLTMSSLVPFRSLRVMEKLGDEIFGFWIELLAPRYREWVIADDFILRERRAKRASEEQGPHCRPL